MALQATRGRRRRAAGGWQCQTPRVSVGVIVPVYGRPRYLREALDAVLGQEPRPDEVIVVDDASPEPVVLTREHAVACRLVRREERGGPGAARDTALELLQTGLVACADADDVWLAGKLAVQGAVPLQFNAYKIPLMRNLVKRAIGGVEEARWPS